MFDTLTLADLYQLHAALAVMLTPMIAKIITGLAAADAAGHWTPEGAAALGEAQIRMAAVRELRELMAGAHAEIQRRHEEASADV